MHLVLIGYRGTGKSVLGARLGMLLDRRVVSLDQEIVRHAGKPIPQIVAESGWPGFRDVEQALCAQYAAQGDLVLDCGGGVVERPENVAVLRQTGKIVWLRAEIGTIVSRIHTDTQRPSLTGAKSFVDEVSEVLQRRTPLYREAADLEVVTDERTPAELTEHIARWFNGLTRFGS
jgi:shikimate kinase